ncbi:2,3-bisphosphoglycerate-independent phosphoglycerate mutase [Patescibacteria group bacterium AH-259-L05]|nr:2,3-bisphosphoglycerate-independent phosphoglycerate mutase [Patescibacteria group bacterium AH-259-L05]
MNSETNKIRPAMLIILDGFGIAPAGPSNAITQANLPVFQTLIKKYPTFTLQASGEAVGLSWGEPGNSEVGHLNMGAGKIIWQSLPLINRAITDGSFFNNLAFLDAIEHVKKNNSDLHLVGLTSDGNVHASIEHMYAILELIAQHNVSTVYIHAILDGRDTPHDAGKHFIADIEEKAKTIGIGKIATISGRFWSMDRDNRWDRIETSYIAMTKGLAEKEGTDPLRVVEESYKNEVYDEEFKPSVIMESNSKPVSVVKDNDAVIYFNFRTDRTRELTKAFVRDDFKEFKRKKLKNLFFVTMTEYEKGLPVAIAFPPVSIKNPLAKIISDNGLQQLHIAETEKYAHVTFFLNGSREEPYKDEDRILIPSPKIASYDQKPEMSAQEVTHRILYALDRDIYSFIVVNFANLDMVAHTGNLSATISALETTDTLIGQIIKMAIQKDFAICITADHGNAEVLVSLKTGEIDKGHNLSPVPFIIVDPSLENKNPPEHLPDLSLQTPSGVLADVAPTILKIMGIPSPKEMTGTSLI